MPYKVDGNQKSGINSPVEGWLVVEMPLFTKVFFTHPNGISALGFLNHQQYDAKSEGKKGKGHDGFFFNFS